MGNKHNRFASITQGPHDTEKGLDLLRGQHGCRLVKDQHIGRAEQHFQNLDTLLDAHGQILDQHIAGDIHSVTRIDGLHLIARRRKVKKIGTACRLNAQNDVFDNAEDRHKHEMLVHHPDSGSDAVTGPVKGYRRTINQDVTRIWLIEARQHIHQG